MAVPARKRANLTAKEKAKANPRGVKTGAEGKNRGEKAERRSARAQTMPDQACQAKDRRKNRADAEAATLASEIDRFSPNSISLANRNGGAGRAIATSSAAPRGAPRENMAHFKLREANAIQENAATRLSQQRCAAEKAL